MDKGSTESSDWQNALNSVIASTEIVLSVGALVPNQQARRISIRTLQYLLVLFSVVHWRKALLGDQTPCNCFGEDSRALSGPQAVARNLVLIGISNLGIDNSSNASRYRLSTGRSIRYVQEKQPVLLLAIVIGYTFVETFRLSSQVARKENATEVKVGFEYFQGTKIQSLQARTLSGKTLSIDEIARQYGRCAFIFLSADCPHCGTLVAIIDTAELTTNYRLPLFFVCMDEITFDQWNYSQTVPSDKIITFHGTSLESILNIPRGPATVVLEGPETRISSVGFGVTDSINAINHFLEDAKVSKKIPHYSSIARKQSIMPE